SPWPAPQPKPSGAMAVAIPAPWDTCFWTLSLEVTCNLQSGANFFVTDSPTRRATAQLGRGSQRCRPAGLLPDEPDLLARFGRGPVHVPPLSPPQRLDLVFSVPANWLEAELILDGQAVTTIRRPIPPRFSPGDFAGLWTKAPRQRLPQRHPNPVLNILIRPDHRVMAVEPDPARTWSVQFPLTGITTQEVRFVPGSSTLQFTAAVAGQTHNVRLHLADDAQHLLLYLEYHPNRPVAYERTD
ncbi:MAG: hypothetical protein ACE5GE_04940, partial [Phycisphaerae bacterium]